MAFLAGFPLPSDGCSGDMHLEVEVLEPDPASEALAGKFLVEVRGDPNW